MGEEAGIPPAEARNNSGWEPGLARGAESPQRGRVESGRETLSVHVQLQQERPGRRGVGSKQRAGEQGASLLGAGSGEEQKSFAPRDRALKLWCSHLLPAGRETHIFSGWSWNAVRLEKHRSSQLTASPSLGVASTHSHQELAGLTALLHQDKG